MLDIAKRLVSKSRSRRGYDELRLRTTKQPSALFDELNKRYWRGRLPKYRVIRRAVLRGDVLGQCDNRRRTILLRSDVTEEQLRLTLLHEMCHIGTGRGYDHGPSFLRKLHRLVRLGETGLLAEDIEHYDGTEVERDDASTGPRTPCQGNAFQGRPGV
jgi:hypothetical protein